MTKKTTADKLKTKPLPDFIKDNDYFAVYPCEKMTVFMTLKPCPVLKGEFSHPNYEFIITQSCGCDLLLDGQKVKLPAHSLLAINSGQIHGTRLLISDMSFISVQFDREFLKELAYGIYGTRELVLKNEPVPCEPEILRLVEAFTQEYEHKHEGFSYILSNLSVQIAIAFFRVTGVGKRLKPSDHQNREMIDKVAEHFRKNYEESFSLDVISQLAKMSKYSFVRKFKQMTGQTPHEYFVDIRIMKAMEHLGNLNYRVIDVALLCGFKNHSHFSQIFRQKTGLSPSEYRTLVLKH